MNHRPLGNEVSFLFNHFHSCFPEEIVTLSRGQILDYRVIFVCKVLKFFCFLGEKKKKTKPKNHQQKTTNALYAADSMNRDTKYLDFVLALLFLWKQKSGMLL